MRQSLCELSFQTPGEGFTNITAAINAEIAKSGMRTGLATCHVKHTSCSHLVVLLKKRVITAADADRLIAATAGDRGLDPSLLAGYRQMIQVDLIDGPRSQVIGGWAANQVYIALGNLLTSAALLGVDTCAIEGFSPPDYDRILQLESSDYQSCVVCACGYRSADDKYSSLAKVRYAAADLIEHR